MPRETVPWYRGFERQMRPGSTLQGRGSIFIDVKILEMDQSVFRVRGSRQAPDGTPQLRGGKQVKLRWKLFHREKPPALERTYRSSEWTFANHRCVMGKHFGF